MTHNACCCWRAERGDRGDDLGMPLHERDQLASRRVPVMWQHCAMGVRRGQAEIATTPMGIAQSLPERTSQIPRLKYSDTEMEMTTQSITWRVKHEVSA